MQCPRCAHENRSGAKFCEKCGTSASGAAPAPRPTEPAGARKIVTIVFADLVGSTALHERLELFGEADAERSVARFVELCAEDSA